MIGHGCATEDLVWAPAGTTFNQRLLGRLIKGNTFPAIFFASAPSAPQTLSSSVSVVLESPETPDKMYGISHTRTKRPDR